MSNIYVTSDWHFGHDKEFIWKPRHAHSIEDMNEMLIIRHNVVVNEDDDVYVLGDLTLGDLEKGKECIEQMNGKLHIVLGNHDTERRIEMYKSLPNVVEVAWAIMLHYKKYHFYMTHFPCLTGNLEKESLRKMTLNLYGHTHQTDNFYEERPYCYHCGVDSHNCFPILLDTVIEQMNAKANECRTFLEEKPFSEPHQPTPEELEEIFVFRPAAPFSHL